MYQNALYSRGIPISAQNLSLRNVRESPGKLLEFFLTNQFVGTLEEEPLDLMSSSIH